MAEGATAVAAATAPAGEAAATTAETTATNATSETQAKPVQTEKTEAKAEATETKNAETVDVEAIKTAYKAELEAQRQKDIEAAKASAYDDGTKAAAERLKAVLGACGNDHALAMQYFEQGMDMAKAKEAYAKHLTDLAAKKIPAGINSTAQAKAAETVAKANASFFDKWKHLTK